MPGVATPAPQGSSPSVAARSTHEDADARACLEFLTNVGVIRCAEKFRHAAPRAAQ
jgi:hypothetical protein